jgi:hypothetical protein
MIGKYRGGRVLGLASAAALVAAGLAAGPATTPALASTGTNIDSSTAATGVADCEADTNDADYYCLWYGQNYTGGVWGSTSFVVDPITGSFTDGDGAVRNNAASMANPTVGCNLTTWVSPDYEGDFNWLDPLNAGNLTSGTVDLRNNEAMISLNTGPGC